MRSIESLLAQAYPAPEFALFYEVANATGFRVRRHADAVAIGVWPSRGHVIIGFEIKTDRRDWLREKKSPEKADVVAAHCDQWYVVTTDDAIAKIEELPAPWGLLVANKDRTRLVTRKPCVPFPDRDQAIMQRSFVAAILRKVPETTVPRADVTRQIEEARQTAIAQTRDGRELRMLQERITQLEQILATFKTATGVDLTHGWQGPQKIAAAVAAVLDLGSDWRQLERAALALEGAAKTTREAIAAWPKPEPEDAHAD